MPRTLEGKGDSFWIDDRARQKKEEERQRRTRRGRTAAGAEHDDSDRSEEAASGEVEDGVIDVVRVEEDDELQWHEVIDVVLHVGGAIAKEKRKKLMERRKRGLHRKTPSTVTIEHVPDDSGR